MSRLLQLMQNPRWLRRLLNIYPPYLGMGIRVAHIAPDFRCIKVVLKLHWYNRNYVGTHFGGSLYAMTDPFYMLMLLQVLGRDYIVWDKHSAIDFVRPGRGRVTAEFTLDDAQIATIKRETAAGQKYLPQFTVDVVDDAGEVVAVVTKTLYVRKKQPQAEPRDESAGKGYHE